MTVQIELRISRMIEAFNIRVETRKDIVLQGMLNKQVALPKFRQSSSPAVSYPAVRMIGHENTTLQQYCSNQRQLTSPYRLATALILAHATLLRFYFPASGVTCDSEVLDPNDRLPGTS